MTKQHNNSGAGTRYPSRAPGFTGEFSGVRVAQSEVFCIVFCRPFLVFILVIVLSVFHGRRASDCPFRIFKLVFSIDVIMRSSTIKSPGQHPVLGHWLEAIEYHLLHE